MDDEYHLAQLDQPAWETIGKGLRAYNTQLAGPELGKALCFVLYDPDQSIAGGVIGETHWGWLFVQLMWIKEDLRGRGFGAQLLQAIEDEAQLRGCTHAYLDTFSFQAPGFYKKHGYREFGKLPDFPPGHERIYLVKEL